MRTARTASGIDATRPLTFTFDGRRLQGFAGDTLASALLANGVWIVGRSFKLHRPRGLLAAGADEPNAIVQLAPGTPFEEPNLKAPQVELYGGLDARSVNCWPSARFDVYAVLGLFKRFLPAGFYYKTFTWPTWHTFEPAIRRAAGLGRAPRLPDPDRYDNSHLHCDVLIVGAGAAGLAAALALSGHGRSVVLVDEQPEAGGALRWCNAQIAGRQACEWVAATVETLEARGVRYLRRTTATGYYEDNAIALVERVAEHARPGSLQGAPKQRFLFARARQVILATGAHERPLVFPHNDRPGIVLSSAAALYAVYYDALTAKTVLAFVNNDAAYAALFAVHDSGTRVATIVDTRCNVAQSLHDSCRTRGITLLVDARIVDTAGRSRVSRVCIESVGGRPRWLDCDLLLMSGGWSPAVHLYSQAGGRLVYDDARAMFIPDSAHPQRGLTVPGSANGALSLAKTFAQAYAAARHVMAELGLPPRDLPADEIACEVTGTDLEPLWCAGAQNASAWVDFQNDVTAADIALAARENFVSVEHLKRYTTAGMGSDQGKTSNVNSLALLGEATGRTPGAVGTTTFRPPYTPVTIGTFGAHLRSNLLRPRLRLPAHSAHLRHGARLDDYGAWVRPAYYPQTSETPEQAWTREVHLVRESVGVFDGSPLGKFEVKGPDAVTFLNAIYVNEIGNLAVGRCRYCLMLNEGGGILDDGVLTRLADDHFLVGTTSAGAQRITEWLTYWREAGMTRYRVALSQVTDAWATFAVAGPRAREVLTRLPLDIPLAADAFPHMSFRSGRFGAEPCRIARVSFTGELTFEVSVPVRNADEVFEQIVAAGATPFGIEAVMVMRAEKGFIHVGVETEPATTPADVGMGAFGSKKTVPFIGQRAARRPAMQGSARLQLVGIEAVDREARLRAGAHLLTPGQRRSEGHLTSAVWSPTLGRSIALAMLADGTARVGTTLDVYDDGRTIAARVVQPCFFDPAGGRLAS
ncbi:sarcosine oxidase subunit alpha [Paraburkholderia sp. UCT70]|uniref:sarcosine oxidase subunit alpha family protein n=1 Tax=Paraburkholderia sp. UCT70 TaxID=2991068 RepID=UPI003D21E7AB